jgi:hypothetical protein
MENTTLTDTTNYGPALIVHNGMLHLAYAGQNGSLYMKRSLNGLDWEEATVKIGHGDKWRFRPALNVWNGGLRVYAVEEACLPGCYNGLRQIDVSSQPNVVPLTTTQTHIMNERTNDSPTTTTWNNEIYVAWAGTDFNKPIYIKHFTGGIGWSQPTIVSGANGIPSLWRASAFRLTIVYRGNNATIYSVGSGNGTSFGVSSPNSATSNASPAPFLQSGSTIWTLYRGQNNRFYTLPMIQ